MTDQMTAGDLPSWERLASIRTPLRKLLVIARFFDKTDRGNIFRQFKRSKTRDVTIINCLIDLHKHPDAGEKDSGLLLDLYEYVLSHFIDRGGVDDNDPALPLLHECFPDKCISSVDGLRRNRRSPHRHQLPAFHSFTPMRLGPLQNRSATSTTVCTITSD